MANRTVQILGQAYGSSPAQITVTANGNTVFSGTVSAVDQPWPALPNLDINLSEIFCTFEIDQAFAGQIPMTCAVSSGQVIFSLILANYVPIPNPVYTQAQLDVIADPSETEADKVAIYTQVANPPLSQADIDALLDPAVTPKQKSEILIAHNCQTPISSGANGYGSIDNISDARSSVFIDGIEQIPDHGELPGTWWWKINTGSTLSYQLDVSAAVI